MVTMANPDLSPAITAIMTERERQIGRGYDAAHDDKHICAELIDAPWGALARIDAARHYGKSGSMALYKRYLIEAAAQIVAEVERIDRAVFE